MRFYQTRKFTTAFLVSVIAPVVFFVTAALLWRHFAKHYWNLSFLTAIQAAGDAAHFGHSIEHTAEVLVVNLLIFSTLSAVAGATIAGGIRYLWIRVTGANG